LQKFPKENPSSSGVKITARVVAIAGMTTADQNSIGTVFEGFDDQIEVNSSCAGETNNSQIRWIFQSACPGEVGTEIGTPVTNEGNDFRFKNSRGAHTDHSCTCAKKCQENTVLMAKENYHAQGKYSEIQDGQGKSVQFGTGNHQ